MRNPEERRRRARRAALAYAAPAERMRAIVDGIRAGVIDPWLVWAAAALGDEVSEQIARSGSAGPNPGIAWNDSADGARAESRGWNFFESDTYGREVERDDEVGLLAADDDAHELIISDARLGDQFAIRSLIHNKQTNPYSYLWTLLGHEKDFLPKLSKHAVWFGHGANECSELDNHDPIDGPLGTPENYARAVAKERTIVDAFLFGARRNPEQGDLFAPRPKLPRWAKPLKRRGVPVERCVFCRGPFKLDIFEWWPDDRSFMIDTCCLQAHEWYSREMTEWTPEEWQQFFWTRAGAHVRGVGGDVAKREQLGISPMDVFTVDMGITLVRSQSIGDRLARRAAPGALSRDEIREFVRKVHSHAPDPPAGLLWGLAVYNGYPSNPTYDGKPRFSHKSKGSRPLNMTAWPPTLIGVAMVGRPVAQATEVASRKTGVKIADVTRVALDHNLPSFLTYKASSMIYDQVYRDACAAGYDKVQTFTLASETGMSLRYARFKPVGVSRGGQATRASRKRKVRSETLAQPKVKWERICANEIGQPRVT